MRNHPPLKSLVIDASKGSFFRYWKDLWEFRELIYFLSWRDVLVRYKQTIIGILWTVLRPLLIMIALSLVFGRLANLAIQQPVPYPLLVFAALLPWQFFAYSLADSSESIINNAGLVSKIYFPRMIIPLSSAIVTFFDFLVSLVLMACIMLY